MLDLDRSIAPDPKFDPAKPLELDMLASPVMPSDFIEVTTVTLDPRPGWAPPRRRPRRVYKKLAARDFKASYTPAPRFTGRSATVQQTTTRHTAPALSAWLDGREVSLPPFVVRFMPLMFDGKDPLQLAPREFWYRDHFVTVEEASWHLLAAIDDGSAIPERIGTTWTGRSFGMGVMVNSPLATRRIEFSAVVYMPPGVDERPVKQALERSARGVQDALMRAARGMSSAKIVARQTCYCPTEDP
jgi:hypothetical protein